MSHYRSKILRNLDYTKQVLTLWKTTIPYIKPFYAIKSCPDKELLNFCNNENIGFDYASKKELELVKDYENVETIFANPTKSIEDIKYSKELGHNVYVIDSIEELIKIQKIDENAEYVIRILSNELFSSIKFNSKFGISIIEFKQILEYLYTHNLSLKGISYHVGSKCTNMKAHSNTINDIINNYLPLCMEYNLMPKLIDIGGGFENTLQLLQLNEELNPLLKTLENNNIELIAEPGRLFSSGIYDVYVKIIALREKVINDMNILFITVNDSVYHTFQGKIYDGQTYEPVPLYNNINNENIRCVILGQTCDSLDVICDNIMMPYPELDDMLLFKNMGAYSLASSNGEFNGFSSGLIQN